MRKPALGALGCLVGLAARRQTSPFVDEKTERLLVNELSGDLAFETLRITTQWHKPSGSEGFFAVARYVEEKAKAAGPPGRALDRPGRRVRRPGRASAPRPGCSRARARRRRRRSSAPTPRSPPRSPTTRAPPTSRRSSWTSAPATARPTTRARTCAARSSSPTASPSAVMEQAVWKRGAAGILAWSSTRLNPLADAPDQIAWQRVPERGRPQRREDDLRVHPVGARRARPSRTACAAQRSDRWGGSGPRRRSPLRVHIVVESSVLARRRRPRWSRRGSRGPTRRCRRSS